MSRTWIILCGVLLSTWTYADGEMEQSDELDLFIEYYRYLPYQSYVLSDDGSTLTFMFSDDINAQEIANDRGAYIPASLRQAIDVSVVNDQTLRMEFSQVSNLSFNPYSPDLGQSLRPRPGVATPAWDTYPVGLLKHRNEIVPALPDDIYIVVGRTTVPNFVFGDKYHLKIHSFVPSNPCAVQDCWVLQGKEGHQPNFVVPN